MLEAELPDDDRWVAGAPAGERDAWESLTTEATRLARESHAETYVGKLRTMLHWTAIFMTVCPSRIMFRPLHGAQHVENAAHNEETFAAFAVCMRRHGSIAVGKQGTPITADHVGGVVSTLRAYRSLEARYNLYIGPAHNLLLSGALRNMRRTDGPAAHREAEVGVRHQHLIGAHAAGFDPRTMQGRFDWCLAHTAVQMLARGGEPGIKARGPGKQFRWDIGFTWGDITWSCPGSPLRGEDGMNHGLPWVRLLWYPIKDPEARHPKIAQYISRTHSGRLGDVAGDPFDALLLDFLARQPTRATPTDPHEPYFVIPTGRNAGLPVDRNYVRGLAQRLARLAGVSEASRVTARAFRIGGAIDIKYHFPDSAAQRLQDRGRWSSDIGHIYAHATEARQLETSRRAAGPTVGRTVVEATGVAHPR